MSSLVFTGSAEAGHVGGGGGGHVGGGGAHVSGGAHFSGRFSGGARFGSSGGVRFSGGARFGNFHGGVVHRGGRGWGRGYYGRGYYGGGWWPGYYGYYPYYGYGYGYGYPYYPEYVTPTYGYGTTYYPVQPAAPGVAVVAPRDRRPPLPTFGIGVFAGGSQNNNNTGNNADSTDVGALARIRLGEGLLVEGEIAKTTFKDNERVDRRIGGSLIYELGARNAFAPYILAGGGVQQADVDGSFSTTQEYGEIGVGLRLALSRNLHIAADIRAGRRQAVDSNQPVEISNTARSVAPPSGTNGSTDTEDYTRGRIAAILNF